MGTILANTRFFPNYPKIMITNPFKAGTHNGIDLVAVPQDEKSTRVDYIKAHDAGIVEATGYDPVVGYFIKIKVGEGVIELYQHLATSSIRVAIGDKVAKGQIIAYMGNTGSASQGAHLHWGITYNGAWIDPTPYLNKDVVIEEAKPTTLKAGDKVTLNNVLSWQSPDTKTNSGTRSGVYYIWSDKVDMGRIRLTNKPERVGVAGQVSFFVNVSDITAKPVATQTQTTTTATAKPVAQQNYYRVQIGGYSVKQNAINQAKKAKAMGYETVIRLLDNVYRVQVGKFSTIASAEPTRTKVINAGFKGAYIVLDKGTDVAF